MANNYRQKYIFSALPLDKSEISNTCSIDSFVVVSMLSLNNSLVRNTRNSLN